MPPFFRAHLRNLLTSHSLRLRTTLTTVALALIIQTLLGSAIYLYQKRAMDTLFSARLRDDAQLICQNLAPLGRRFTDDELRRAANEALFFSRGEGFMVAVHEADGRPIASSSTQLPDLRAARYPHEPNLGEQLVYHAPMEAFGRLDSTDARVLIQLIPGESNTHHYLLIASLDSQFEAMNQLTKQLLFLALPVGLIATGIAAWLISGFAIAPLGSLRQVAGVFAPETIREAMPVPQTAVELDAFKKDLEEARERLRVAIHAQDRFISNVSHELKTPIAILLTEAETVSTSSLPMEAKTFVQSVQIEMRRLGQTLESFLTLTRVSGGKALAKLQRAHVNDFVMAAIRNCTSVAKQKGVALETRLDETAAPLVILGDAELLTMMLEQIIRNSIRVSPDGDSILVSVSSTSETCFIGVRDRGPEVPPSLLTSLFNRFADNSDNCSHARQGLGLSIAKGIAELHKGAVTVTNVDCGGCDFIVELPLALSPVATD